MNVHVWCISSLFESFNILKAQGTPGALKRILQPEFDQKMVNEFFHEFEILKAYTASVIIGTLSQMLAGFQDLQLTKELVHQEIPVAPLARKNPCRQRYCSSHWSRRLRFPGSDRREAIWLQATAPWWKKTQTVKNSQGHTIPGRLFNLLNPHSSDWNSRKPLTAVQVSWCFQRHMFFNHFPSLKFLHVIWAYLWFVRTFSHLFLDANQSLYIEGR